MSRGFFSAAPIVPGWGVAAGPDGEWPASFAGGIVYIVPSQGVIGHGE